MEAAARLEELAVAAYNGQAPNVTAEVLVAAARIVSARHAAWIRSVAGRDAARQRTDKRETRRRCAPGSRISGSSCERAPTGAVRPRRSARGDAWRWRVPDRRAAALLALTADAHAAGRSKNDVSVLNYAPSLEYPQAALYTESERSKALKGRAAEAATQVGAAERARVKGFRALLPPEDPKQFLKTAVAFEDLAVEAYEGQAPRLHSKQVLAAALGIHPVEARHAAWMRYLNGIEPARVGVRQSAAQEEDRQDRARNRFVAQKPHRTARRRPRYTG